MMVTVQEMQKNDAALIERLTAHVAELQENRQKLINTHIAVITRMKADWKADIDTARTDIIREEMRVNELEEVILQIRKSIGGVE